MASRLEEGEYVPEGTLFYELDIRSGCAEAFEEFEPEAVCHQAAQMDVRRSYATVASR